MSFRNVRESYWTPCTCGSDRPCSKHPEKPSDGNNLFTPEELIATDFDELKIVARRMYLAISSHVCCPACSGEAAHAMPILKRLGVIE